MPNGMSINDVAVCVADDSSQDAGAGVRRQTENQLSNKVLGFFNVVVGWQLVDAHQQVVDESGDLDEVFACPPGNHYVLDFEFADLVGSVKGLPWVS